MLTLRAMRAEDAAAMAALVRAAFAAQPVAPDPPMSALRLSGADVAAHFAAGAGGIAAEAGGRLVGGLLWERQGNALHLSRIAVDPGWRRLGIARRMLAQAERLARDRGLGAMTLSTRLVLTGNRALFAAAGFVETGMTAHPGYAHPTSVEMAKQLD